ncbi:YIP1 family protein [Marimonas arenosa]|uniref:YIP1 family protein n=1 Tax=Marimonas arenosa TaxID=1795305 RepID=A0AAE3W8M6_9RHOB|nr:YIP1 family protein [Marimonas arenosa]MDQ2088651.1 YIP1 family protein [Marimonas arenosa]
MTVDWQALVKLTIFDPKQAAEKIMALRRNLSHAMLWSMVVLVAALMALSIWLSWQVFPPMPSPDPEVLAFQQRMARFVARPALLAVLFAGSIVLAINILHWAGRLLGGEGELHDMAAVFLWLQVLQTSAMVLILLLALVSAPLAGLIEFAISLLGLWILVAFVDRVHGFGNPLKAVGTLLLGPAMLFAIMVVVLVLLGAGAEGGMGNV